MNGRCISNWSLRDFFNLPHKAKTFSTFIISLIILKLTAFFSYEVLTTIITINKLICSLLSKSFILTIWFAKFSFRFSFSSKNHLFLYIFRSNQTDHLSTFHYFCPSINHQAYHTKSQHQQKHQLLNILYG